MSNLVLIPGVLCNHHLWDDFTNALHGFSFFCASPAQQPTIQAMAEALLSRASPPFWAVGFSLGGWVALEMYRLNPNAIEGLILISTTDGTLLDSARISMQQAITEIKKGDFEKFINRAPALYLTPEHADSPLADRLKNMMREVGPQTAVLQYQSLLNLEKPFAFLDTVSCPTLVIRGEEDKRNTLAMSQTLVNAIPQAQLRVIKNSAHFIPLEQPTVLAAEVSQFILGGSDFIEPPKMPNT